MKKYLVSVVLALAMVVLSGFLVISQPTSTAEKNQVALGNQVKQPSQAGSSSVDIAKTKQQTQPSPPTSTTLSTSETQPLPSLQSSTHRHEHKSHKHKSTSAKPTTSPVKPPVTQPVTSSPTQQPSASDGQVLPIEKEVVRLVNVERQKRGLNPLRLNVQLTLVARKKADDMKTNNYFDHNSPTYGSPSDMLKKFGIPFQMMGENIAAGQQTAQDVVTAWMNSAGHRANILNPDFTDIGVGYVKGGSYGCYWSQMFIK